MMSVATEKVKEVLLGFKDEPQLSAQIRASFMKHAKTDEESGEYFLKEQDFVNAIAPADETYVSWCPLPETIRSRLTESN